MSLSQWVRFLKGLHGANGFVSFSFPFSAMAFLLSIFFRWTLVSTASDMPLHLLKFVFLPGRYFLIIEKISGVCRKFATARKNVSWAIQKDPIIR
jgi:hypothetical protein